LCIGAAREFENGVDALSEFRIGQADGDAGAHLRMRHHRGLDLGRIDIRAAAQDHVGKAAPLVSGRHPKTFTRPEVKNLIRSARRRLQRDDFRCLTILSRKDTE
jgi:hypothetical protein